MKNHSLQFSTNSMNSRHLILHPSLGLDPLHVLAKFKITAPGEERREVGLWTSGEGGRRRRRNRQRQKWRQQNTRKYSTSKSNDHNHANSVMF